MDVEPVLAVRSPIEGAEACDELRAHGIKCDCVEPTTPFVPTAGMGSAVIRNVPLQVVVAVEDAERARQVLSARKT